MRSVWRVGTYLEDVWVVRSFGATIPESAHRISPEDAAWSAERWFFNDGASRLTLVELLEAIGHPSNARPNVIGPLVREDVRKAFLERVLEAYRVPEKLTTSSVDKEPEKPAEQARPVEKKTFIAIELVDDDSPPKPVPFKRYRIELPDHSIREGMLDANGRARIDGIDPGTCKVSFPSFHADDWQAA
jgi:hypothetical protein